MKMNPFPALVLAVASLCPVLADSAESTLDKVRRTGEVVLAYRDTSMPFSYLDASAQPIGFGYDICLKIADELRRVTGRADLKAVPFAVLSTNRIPLMQNGTTDVECTSTTNNSERQKQVAFSINYFYAGTRFLVRAGSPVRSLADLRGQTVVVTSGTTNFKLLRRLNEEQNLGLDLIGAKDPAESALAVQTGRAAAYATDDVLLYFLRASAQRPQDWMVVGDSLQVEPYAVMFRRDDPAFKALVDGVIARLMASGEFEALYAKWFQSPVPPAGVNLQIPMGRELRENLKVKSDRPAF